MIRKALLALLVSSQSSAETFDAQKAEVIDDFPSFKDLSDNKWRTSSLNREGKQQEVVAKMDKKSLEKEENTKIYRRLSEHPDDDSEYDKKELMRYSKRQIEKRLEQPSSRCMNIQALHPRFVESNDDNTLTKLVQTMNSMPNPSRLDEITEYVNEELVEFCVDIAKYDQDCFFKMTSIQAPADKYSTLWAVWDTDNNQELSNKEYQDSFILMDLDMDNETTELEIKAYLARNQYLLCRPVREKVDDAIQSAEVDALLPIYKTFVFKDASEQFQHLDNDFDGQISKTEWDAKLKQMFVDICLTVTLLSRYESRKRAESSFTLNRHSVFELADDDFNAFIDRKEFDNFIKSFDSDGDKNFTGDELLFWFEINRDALCYESNIPIIKQLNRSADHGKALYTAFSFLDQVMDHKANSSSNAQALLKWIDENQNEVLEFNEVETNLGNKVYGLVYEYALTRQNPFEYIRMLSEHDGEDALTILFPNETSALDQKTIKNLLEKGDLNSDGKFTIEEFAEGFNKHWHVLTKGQSIEKHLLNALENLNLATVQPMRFVINEFEYYFSSSGHVLNYTQAESFCEQWGGQVLKLFSAQEYDTLREFQGNANNRGTWYSSDSFLFNYQLDDEPIGTPTTRPCLVLDLSQEKRRYADCSEEREFVCRKINKLLIYQGDYEETELVQGILTTKKETWIRNNWIYVVIAIIVFILILIVCCYLCLNRKKSSETVAQKVPLETPGVSQQVSPRNTTNMEFPDNISEIEISSGVALEKNIFLSNAVKGSEQFVPKTV